MIKTRTSFSEFHLFSSYLRKGMRHEKAKYNIEKFFDSSPNALCIMKLLRIYSKMKINLSYLHKKLKEWK
ncbi:hypothetical protein [Leptospira santarosai]|uniref:Uncharacterized protein n=1 Tax=Leptospira santarosai serovar Shermani str. LT 821 TaxID=758847 RepID=K8Y4B2_9LEPT|nr:hypothetical protein [Leptospira santarosai]EKT87831.1 hypothetical protein LSS_05683 [Leptospira santarosai serovar Shermani str. LT 821]